MTINVFREAQSFTIHAEKGFDSSVVKLYDITITELADILKALITEKENAI